MMYHIYSLQGFGLAGAQGDIGVHPPVSCQKPGHRERGTSMLSVWLLVSLIPKTLSPLTSSALCWIDIVDIAMLIRYRVYIVMIVIISRMSKLQCWYDIEFASLSSLSFPVCRHRNVDTISSLHRYHRYHFPFVDIVDIVDITMYFWRYHILTSVSNDIKTPCQHCISLLASTITYV